MLAKEVMDLLNLVEIISVATRTARSLLNLELGGGLKNCPCSSLAEHILGKDGVASSILALGSNG